MEQSINTRIFDSSRNLFDDLADDLIAHIQSLSALKQEISITLAGGGTPRSLYRVIAENYKDSNWGLVRFFFGDERYVPYDHVHSNYRTAREILFEPLHIYEKYIFPMPTSFSDPEEAAANYENTLKNHFSSTLPQFDILFLGLGSDGHTASLFPSTKALAEKDRWVAVGQAPNEPRIRLSLTLPVINNARRIIFVAIGADKADAVKCAIKGSCDHHASPAGLVRPVNGKLEWWLDSAAAAKL
jgi:6-phosphogluconolactonase